MATPMTADQFVKALKDEGVTVHEHAGWRTHNRAGHGAWGPMYGVVIHHTAGTDSLELVYKGRSDLPGPLAHTHLSKSGVATMVGNGRANHAGTFAQNAVTAMKNESATHPRPDSKEPVDANACTYGIEIENLGNGRDPYPSAQYTAAVRWAAAICRFHGWTENSVIGHREGTRRKVDPSFPDGMDQFRKDVKAQLAKDVGTPAAPKPAPAPKPKPKPKPVVDLSNIVYAAHHDPDLPQGRTTHPADVKLVEAALKAEGLLTAAYSTDGSFGSATVRAYAKWQKRCGVGTPYDGIPGKASLTKLGAAHGFTVKS